MLVIALVILGRCLTERNHQAQQHEVWLYSSPQRMPSLQNTTTPQSIYCGALDFRGNSDAEDHGREPVRLRSGGPRLRVFAADPRGEGSPDVYLCWVGYQRRRDLQLKCLS